MNTENKAVTDSRNVASDKLSEGLRQANEEGRAAWLAKAEKQTGSMRNDFIRFRNNHDLLFRAAKLLPGSSQSIGDGYRKSLRQAEALRIEADRVERQASIELYNNLRDEWSDAEIKIALNKSIKFKV